jgi:hypothetical protein
VLEYIQFLAWQDYELRHQPEYIGPAVGLDRGEEWNWLSFLNLLDGINAPKTLTLERAVNLLVGNLWFEKYLEFWQWHGRRQVAEPFYEGTLLTRVAPHHRGITEAEHEAIGETLPVDATDRALLIAEFNRPPWTTP